jgi:parafibromin
MCFTRYVCRDRVVAVFTGGAAWQFKDWKWTSPIEVFDKSKSVKHVIRDPCNPLPFAAFGVHLYLDDRVVDPTVKTWNVTRLAISKQKRHLDKILTSDFWRLLEKYLLVKRPEFCTPAED